jgi:hypothetical protein
MKVAVVIGAVVAVAALASAVALTRTKSGRGLPSAEKVACTRPYAAHSPWNTPIGADPVVDPDSGVYVGSLGTDRLRSNPRRYTFPVYEVDAAAPLVSVRISDIYSNVSKGGSSLAVSRDGASVSLRLPAGAQPSAGTDAQMIVLDPATGDEWGFWKMAKDASGAWTATNGYHYNTAWSSVPPEGFGSRGSGLPYLAGLIRPCEIAQGHIDHALAFAYDYPASGFVYPATKSDGLSDEPPAMPEGSRLQLDPSLSDGTIESWGCTGACLIIAHALQRYGMYVIDNAGHDKIYAEGDQTANWNGRITSTTVSPIGKAYLRRVL